MKVRMKVSLKGSLDGVSYPAAGAEWDVADAAGVKLCEKGYAEPVAQKSAEKAEKRPAARKAEKRG